MQRQSILTVISIMIGFIRCLPHLLIYAIHPNRNIIQYEIDRWLNINKKNYNRAVGLIYLLQTYPEYRNLFYYRIGGIRRLFSFLCPPMSTLYLRAEKIGKGLFIQHGFASTIGAKSMGEDCWVNQQITIGYKKYEDAPVIGNNVTVYAGAIILGSITIGDNATVGANAVVVKDVPPNATVVGVPAYEIKPKKKKTTS